jgi:hypothetical protein
MSFEDSLKRLQIFGIQEFNKQDFTYKLAADIFEIDAKDTAALDLFSDL